MTVQTSVAHDDDVAVQVFANAMCRKLAKKRAEGRGGWKSMDSEELASMLIEHLVKGDPLDIANLSMFLAMRGRKKAEIRNALRQAFKDFVLVSATCTLDLTAK